MELKDWMTAALAVVSIVLSLWVWYSTASLQRREIHTGSMTDYQKVLFEINATMLQYPTAARVFEAGRLSEPRSAISDQVPGVLSATSLAQSIQSDDLFRLRVLVLYHLDLLELVYEYHRDPMPLSASEVVVRDSWELWSKWLVSGNRHVREYVCSNEFGQTYNPHFVSHARKQAATTS